MAEKMVAQENVPQCPVFLTGLMASGKTTVASLLAARWQVPWIDLDVRCERMTGMTIADIIAQQDESGFRHIEECVLSSLLQEPGFNNRTLVVATGGGIVIQEKNRALMHQIGRVIYLQALPQIIIQRLQKAGEISKRPLLANSSQPPIQQLEELLRQRKAAYEQADLLVDANQSAFECVQQIISNLPSLPQN